jgi:hypothetical protein
MSEARFPRRIISGGQTGVDRAALDIALELGIEHGGWCPKGRKSEEGPIDDRYQLVETSSPEYHVRTELNVLEADATLLIVRGSLTGGSKLTERFALRHGRPLLLVDLEKPADLPQIRAWIADNQFAVLNVAGPRESSFPGIYHAASLWLRQLLSPARK